MLHHMGFRGPHKFSFNAEGAKAYVHMNHMEKISFEVFVSSSIHLNYCHLNRFFVIHWSPQDGNIYHKE